MGPKPLPRRVSQAAVCHWDTDRCSLPLTQSCSWASSALWHRSPRTLSRDSNQVQDNPKSICNLIRWAVKTLTTPAKWACILQHHAADQLPVLWEPLAALPSGVLHSWWCKSRRTQLQGLPCWSQCNVFTQPQDLGYRSQHHCPHLRPVFPTYAAAYQSTHLKEISWFS